MGVRPSMGSVGDAYDNAMCESFFATLECELLDHHRFQTQVEARTAIFEFIEGWYNPHRRHSALDYQSPINYERKKIAEQEREIVRWKQRAERAEALAELQKSCRALVNPAREREVRLNTVGEVGPRLGIAPTCAALGVSTASYYRRCEAQARRPAPALGSSERAAVLGVLHGPRSSCSTSLGTPERRGPTS